MIVPKAAPVITVSASGTALVGASFTYQIAASNNPTNYDATGLPPGLAVNTGTGLISGTPMQSGSFSVTLSASNTGGSGAATLIINVFSPFQTWAAQYFTPQQLNDPLISGPNGDLNHNGIPNILEYLLHLNPAVTNADDFAELPTPVREVSNGVEYLTLTYRRNSLASDLDVQVEVSSTLVSESWRVIVPDVVESLPTDVVTGDPRFKVKVNVNGRDKQFIRLKVTP